MNEYLIDQLSNSMELYNRDEFIKAMREIVDEIY